MKRLDITTVLDLVGLVLVSAGAGAGLWRFLGGFALIAAGVALILGSWAAARNQGRS